MPDRVLNTPASLYAPATGILEADRQLHYPRNEVAETIEVSVPVTFRPAGLASPVTVKRDWLAELLPNGSNSYVGLFGTTPSTAGVGGSELSGGGYARVGHSAWVTSVTGHVVRRANVGPVRFSPFTADLTASAWGVWDAITGGTLLAFGYIRNSGGSVIVQAFAATDEPQFIAGELVVGIQ